MPQIGETRKARDCNQIGHCKYIWHACVDCGKERWVVWHVKAGKPRSERCPSCGLKHAGRGGSKSPSWKGGRQRVKSGYIGVWVASDDFFHPMANNHNYVLEHRLVMAKHLNRCLLPWEVVHHKDGIKDHNELRNLEVMSDRRYHIIDSAIKRYIRELESENKKVISKLNDLIVEIRLLRLENKQLKGGGTTCKKNGEASIPEPSHLRIGGNKRTGRSPSVNQAPAEEVITNPNVNYST